MALRIEGTEKGIKRTDMTHIVDYKYSKGKITKDGHTMFDMDIVSDLNRKSFLEANKQELEFQLKESKSDHIATLKLLQDVVNGKIEFKRKTVNGRIKKYIDTHQKELI